LSGKQKFCGECGARLPDGAGFCGECGAAVQQSLAEHGSQVKKEKKKQKPTLKLAENQNGFKIFPLVIWAGTWSAGWILAPLFYALLISDFYYVVQWLEGLLFLLAVSLIVAALLQWCNITSGRPTAKIALIVVCAWFVFNFVMQWMHLTYAIIAMALIGSLVGGCLAWLIAKQIVGSGPSALLTNSINKFICGWSICGACGGIFSGYFPSKLLIGAVLFLAALTTIVIKRAR